MISDVFSGVALSVERAYNLGDYLEIEMRSRPGGAIVGKVVEINWRATRLQSMANEIVVIPNSELARTKFINFQRPGEALTRRGAGDLEPCHSHRESQAHPHGRPAEYRGIMKEPPLKSTSRNLTSAAWSGVCGSGSAITPRMLN